MGRPEWCCKSCLLRRATLFAREMTEFLALGRYVAGGVATGRDVHTNPLHHVNSRRSNRRDLLGVVCHQAESSNSEDTEKFRWKEIIASVNWMAELQICLN